MFVLSGIHIGWWSMAQLAAQDYFSRLQATGLSAFPHPADLAAAFPGAAGLGGIGATGNNTGSSSSGGSRQNNGDSKGKGRKEKKSNSGNSGHNNNSMSNSSSVSGLNMSGSSPSSYKVSWGKLVIN